jgi:hypothetical protein
MYAKMAAKIWTTTLGRLVRLRSLCVPWAGFDPNDFVTEAAMTSRDTIWAGGTFCDPSRRMMLTVLDAGSRRGWLYFDGVPLTSCAPLPCDAPLDWGWPSAVPSLQPGRRYRDAATGLRFRCLRSAPGALRFGSSSLIPVEVTQTRTLPSRRHRPEGPVARSGQPFGASTAVCG